MKVLTVASVIAFILGDYGTFQVNPIEYDSRDDQIALFKKYALELVNAAAASLYSKQDTSIMDGAFDCLSNINIAENRNPMDIILLTMTIAKDFKKLQKMRITSVVGDMGINDALVGKIRSLLAAIQLSSAQINKVLEVEVVKKYLWNHGQGSSAAGPSSSDRSINSLKRCYQSMRSLDDKDNIRFTQQLSAGFVIARSLMNDDNKDLGYDPRWNKLNGIVKEISSLSLKTVKVDYSDEQFVKALELLFDN